MATMKEGLDLMVRLAKAEAEVDRMKDIERQLKLIASKLTQTSEFYDWLLLQDRSCAVTYSPERKVKGVHVEDESDVTLALAFSEERG